MCENKHMNSAQSVGIVFDIGGTKTRIAKVEGDELADIKSFDTPHTPEEGITLLVETAKKISKDFCISAAVGDISGIVKDGTLHRAPHLPLWNGTALASLLRGAFDAPVTLFNDAELVALGEYFYGAGKGENNMLYVTVSTGVGGAHVVQGKIRRGTYNIELGHQLVNGEELENLISGTAVQKKYGVAPKDFDDEQTLVHLADVLAQGLYNSVLNSFPEVIVLGGSMIVGQNAIPLERVQKTLSSLVKKYYPTAPRITMARLGSDGGLYGGLAYLQHAV